MTPVPGLDTHYQSVQQLNSDNEGAGKGSGDIVVEDAEGSSDITPLIPPPSMFISPVTTREIHVSCYIWHIHYTYRYMYTSESLSQCY